MKSILEYLESTTEKYGGRAAVDDGTVVLTWSELTALARKLGAEFCEMTEPGKPVMIFAEKSAATLAAMFGALYAGCFYAVVDPTQPLGRIREFLKVLEPALAVTEPGLEARLKEAGYEGRIWQNCELTQSAEEASGNDSSETARTEDINGNRMKDEAANGSGASEGKLAAIREKCSREDILYTMFTSGSTGTPKAVAVSHGAAGDFISHFVETFGFTENDRIGNQAPFDFDVSVKDIYTCVLTGAQLVLIPKKMFAMPPVLLDYLCEKKVSTLIWAVSALTMVSSLKGLRYRVPESVTRVLFSGEVMPVKQLRQWQAALPKAEFVNLYGPTEITCNCTYYRIDRMFEEGEKLPLGQPFAGREVFLQAEDGTRVSAAGETGEICVAGESLASGYYHNPAATAEKFAGAYYRTGDLGYYGTDGELYFCGRRDFQIKHMGHRIELEEIERAMYRTEGVERACCLLDAAKNKLVAFYLGDAPEAEVKKQLKYDLPPYMVPHKLMRVEEMPLNKNGKTDRAYLKRLLGTAGDRTWLEEAISRYGTPTYVFHMEEMLENVAFYRKKLGARAHLCYAMKANSFVTGQMAEAVDRIEVCSMGEYRICRTLGIAPEKLLISGVLKKEEDLAEILNDCGSRCVYTVESLRQLAYFERRSSERREKLRLYLRLSSGNQFGMDEQTIGQIWAEQARYPWLELLGIHYFSGTQKKKAGKFAQELTRLDAFFETLEKTGGVPVRELEYGPGFAVAYFEGQTDTREDDADALMEALGKMRWQGAVTLEMGRALAARGGYYLTGVRDCKQTDGKNYCIVDGGIHQLNYDGQICGMYRPHVQLYPRKKDGEEKEWTVCGSLCTANDVLIKKAALKGLETGDVLVFERAGAYAAMEGMALFLSHELPGVVLYEAGTWKVLRKEQETYHYNMERMKEHE